jgi:predicted lactoylglutathione lyase
MIAHISLKVSDIAKAKEFYSKALAPLGFHVSKEFPDYKMIGMMSGEGNTELWLDGNGCKQSTHVAFGAKNEEQVQAFYKAALEAGGKDNGAPGYRTDYGAGYYAAFVLDHDGHNIEAMYWNDSK